MYTCRISKYPLNRVWPGFQRPGNQTELSSFVNLISDEAIEIKVVTSRPYEKILIKPYSKQIVHEEKNGEITFVLKENGNFVLEANSYHHCLYIFNSKPVLCEDKDSVTHYFGPGVHMPGKISLKDNESVYVDKDALVFGSIFAENARNIRVFGNGLFDDACEGRIAGNCYEEFTNGNIKFYDCENIKVEGVLFRDSAIWCVNIFHCDNAEFDNIKVFGQWRYNTDGVDIVNSRNITVKNSFIHSFDDTITIKGIEQYAYANNENILIDNCTLWCDWGRTCEIGVETACREYKHITFRNCDILRGGAVAMEIATGDSAEVSDILYENINVEYNSFDTPEVYQESDDHIYQAQDRIGIPYLIQITNQRWKNPETLKLCGFPLAMDEIDLDGIQFACVHDITYKNINVYYDEKIPKVDEKYNVPIRLESVLENVEHYNINIQGIQINGTKIDKSNALIKIKGVRNITEEVMYEQIKKNSVKATNQLKESDYVSFENPDGKGIKVLFVGNSITRHGIAHDIGWHNNWGMAASSKEKDYVHRLIDKIDSVQNDAAYCICQVASWGQGYKGGTETFYEAYRGAHDFNADIIVLRFIENCSFDGWNSEIYKLELEKLLAYFNPSGNAKVVITTGFWHHCGNEAIREFSKEHGMPLVELGDLGEMDEMKAIGLFEHSGVANHPGDLGMEKIAERIWGALTQTEQQNGSMNFN